ncbi:uncharacterized protein LTR77_007708 [Saxophila tyrrhenica]|uniref:Nitrogen regulatory protein areA GATA-like domain-containing protein n=1 Tax=Saxophila tyrrhenica TaxID=1690608 RepID=A0AAV9P2V3_9PEZI|nr:hypothetical protein LTR77_007708 [Saxophila tyrrhenica]
MPFRPRYSFLKLDSSTLSDAIQTDHVEDLYGMWSLLAKASNTIENGKRLENLSWRLFSRETFCCKKVRTAASETMSSSESSNEVADDDASSLPALSSSCGSFSSQESGPPKSSPPELKCASTCGQRHEKHITPREMQKIIQTIEDTQEIEPIELPTPSPSQKTGQTSSMSASQDFPTLHLSTPTTTEPSHDTTPQPSSVSASRANLLESSSSTVDTQDDHTSQTVGSEGSSNTEMSTHSIVRGFVPGGAPSSYRSQTSLAPQPTPILRTSPTYQPSKPKKKKDPVFTIGTSSGEDESSFESHMYKSSLSESFKRGSNVSSASSKKQTSFKDEVSVGRAAEHSPVFEESDDEDEEVSESAIEDDDDSSDWEDSDDHSGPSSVNESQFFQRVDSRPNLVSRRSLLTTQLHEPDRARALANAASRSTPAIRQTSRRSTPNGPSVATSPEPTAQLHMPPQDAATQARPIIMTTSNMHQSALSLSPRTTRRNMLSTELTESLRKNLLWERQHRSTGNLAAMKRRQPANEGRLKQRPEPGPVLSQQENPKKFSNDFFNAGLQEYHAKGW